MTHEEKDIIKPATAIQKVIKSLFSKKQFHHSNIVITFVFKLGGAATPPSPTEYHKRAAEARKDKDMNKDKLTGVEKSIHAAVETFQKNLCREMAKRLDEGKLILDMETEVSFTTANVDEFIEEQIQELSKLLDLGEQSFDTFRMDYYSTSFWPEWGTSPRENMELVYEVCLNYAQKFGRFYFKNLFLSGAPGLGKTFLSACIARTVSENGHSVVYDTAGNVFAQFEARKFLRDSDDGREARDETRRYLGCDLLILDDLGSELTTQFTQSALYELINGRLVGGKRTVISSNLSMEEAAVRYSPQIASRLEGEYHLLHFFGEDIRLLRKKQL